MIRTAILAMAIGLAVVAAGAGEARAQNAPWCAIVEIGSGLGENCGFQTYEHCIATVQGQGGYCQRNARYQPPAQDRSSRQGPQHQR